MPKGLTRGKVFGGIAAQGTQAAVSLVLQVVVARALGVEALGAFAALYSAVILATAISSGLVGDSLTVLDRSDHRIRAALQTWGLVCGAVFFIVAWIASMVTDLLTPASAVAFGFATGFFVIEDVLRRLLMANLKFWRLVIVDLSALAGSLAVLVCFTSLDGDLGLTAVMWALATGQFVGLLVAGAVVPRLDRYLVRLRSPDLRAVMRYGAWRAIQQAVRPTLLAIVKTWCLAVAGALAAGQLEAARIYAAPALLVVGGVSSTLFASYAAQRSTDLKSLRQRADRAVVFLVVAIGLFATVATLALPLLGEILTGGRYSLPAVAVVGWFAYAAAVAAVTPYGSLAAVRGRQAIVLGLRIADSVLSLGVAAMLMLANLVEWIPMGLAVGSLIGGTAIRQLLLSDRAIHRGFNGGVRETIDEVVPSRKAEILRGQHQGSGLSDRWNDRRRLSDRSRASTLVDEA